MSEQTQRQLPMLGRIAGVCSAVCSYVNGVCVRCGSLDPDEYLLFAYRIPSHKAEERRRIEDDIRDAIARAGLNPDEVLRRVG